MERKDLSPLLAAVGRPPGGDWSYLLWTEEEKWIFPDAGWQWWQKEEEVNPLELLVKDPAEFVAWQQAVGEEKAMQMILEATKKHIREYGPLSVLDLIERMDYIIAQIEEHVDESDD